ncbi:MAG: phosphatidate cytidylyltransferase [Planctomycetes bacterium]|nr:phosphatidate cytidylyltransferase [Planctomycetota bacterium]
MAGANSKAGVDRYKYGILLILFIALTAYVEAQLLPGSLSSTVVGILAFACAAETAAMFKAAGVEPLSKISLGLAAAVVCAVALPRLGQSMTTRVSFVIFRAFGTAELGLLAFAFFAAACVLRQKTGGAAQTLGAGAVVILVATGLLYMIDIRYFNGSATLDGLELLIFLVAVSKVGDIAAFIVGSAVGKHKLIPAVSPGKTWEGALASLVAACGVAALFGIFHFAGPLTAETAAAGGIVINIAAQFGDLAESLLKRSAGVKDSGNWLPQFGGAFDLVDSLFLAAPIFHGFLRIVSL